MVYHGREAVEGLIPCQERVEAEGMVYAEFLKKMKKDKRGPAMIYLVEEFAFRIRYVRLREQ